MQRSRATWATLPAPGPFQNDRPQATGEYVTVWRKQPDGQWKFAVDMGIERIGVAPSPAATCPSRAWWLPPPPPARRPPACCSTSTSGFRRPSCSSPAPTYQQYLSSEARLYRPGLTMMQGGAAVANMKNLDRGYLFTATTGYLAAAGDLGYVVGKLHRAASSKHPEENGSYTAHLAPRGR